MAETDYQKVASRTLIELYESNRMSFGVTTAPPSTFQRAMNAVLGVLRGRTPVVNVDRVLIMTDTYRNRNLNQVLTVL